MAAPHKILYAPADADDPAYRAAIAALTGGVVDYFDARAATPTAVQLAAYECVYTMATTRSRIECCLVTLGGLRGCGRESDPGRVLHLGRGRRSAGGRINDRSLLPGDLADRRQSLRCVRLRRRWNHNRSMPACWPMTACSGTSW